MNSVLKDMIKDYDLKQDSEINIAKEIMQKICLSALSRTAFLQKLLLVAIHVQDFFMALIDLAKA